VSKIKITVIRLSYFFHLITYSEISIV
jgi:hypothetical protein